MPANCSKDVQTVIEHIDSVFLNGSQEEVNELKSNFGLGEMSHLDDVAGSCQSFADIYTLESLLTITSTVRNNIWSWQSLQPNTGANSPFYQFCDALEVRNGEVADEDGWGLDYALQAWGGYWNETYYNQRRFMKFRLDTNRSPFFYSLWTFRCRVSRVIVFHEDSFNDWKERV